MKEKHRETKVLEAEAQVGECLDCRARIISKGLAPSRMLVLQVREWMQLWRKCSYAHRQVEEQPSKRSAKNGDKSAVAMLKKDEQHDG